MSVRCQHPHDPKECDRGYCQRTGKCAEKEAAAPAVPPTREEPMTTTPTDDLPALPEPRLWYDRETQRCSSMAPLRPTYEALFDETDMRAYALADRQARAAQPALARFKELDAGHEADPVERLRAFCSLAMSGQDWIDVEPFFDAVVQARAAQAEPVAWMDDFGNVFPLAANKGAGSWLDEHKREWRPLYTTPPAQPKAEPPLTESERPTRLQEVHEQYVTESERAAAPQPEQQSTAQPVAEAYQRGIVQGMNDVLHNGIDWARAKFGGAPLTASKPSEPAQEALKVALRMALAAMVKVGGSSEMTPGRYFDELAEPIDAARAALAQIDALSNPRQDESTP